MITGIIVGVIAATVFSKQLDSTKKQVIVWIKDQASKL